MESETSIAPQQAQNNGGLPGWAKFLIGLFVAGLILFGALVALGIYGVDKIAKTATSPGEIAKVSEKIGSLQNPPPGGFHYMYALDVGGAQIIALMHSPDNLNIVLRRQENLQKVDPERILARESSATTDITQHGEETVAGKKMLYTLGTTTVGPAKMQHMVGVIGLNDNSKVVVITGDSPGDAYNMASTKEFLSGIKSFN